VEVICALYCASSKTDSAHLSPSRGQVANLRQPGQEWRAPGPCPTRDVARSEFYLRRSAEDANCASPANEPVGTSAKAWSWCDWQLTSPVGCLRSGEWYGGRKLLRGSSQELEVGLQRSSDLLPAAWLRVF
jgi:hypothetical protein